MHRASFTIPCADDQEASVLLEAVRVEADEGPDGTTTTLTRDGAVLCLELTGDDLSVLRAAVHSVLRLLDAARRSMGA